MSVALLRPSSADAIDKCTAKLGIAFQRHLDVVTFRVYREALADLPQWAIEAAALELQRKGGAFFPPAPVWHQAAEALIADRTRETMAQTRTAAGHECDTCRDTGWVEEERGGRVVCLPCSCRPTNSTYRQLTASSRK